MGLSAASLNYAFPMHMTESTDGQETGYSERFAASDSIHIST